ncbi:MAG: Holliday junction resolvase RuvX [Phycisphaerae bacterium]|nr:Holliday junction resolvase RuvX [Phycisphaerae bacterium]
MTRYLGIDYGEKRIGLAVGDDVVRLASPVETIDNVALRDERIAAILRVAADYAADAFVLGLPLNMDDSEGPQAKVTRAFGDALAKASGKPVHYFDERLSSHTAGEKLIPAELTRKRKKSRLDAVAAQVMLQEFLDSSA